MKLVITPPALAELHDAATFYTLKANVELGLAFVAEFERTANLVLDTLCSELNFALIANGTLSVDLRIASSIRTPSRKEINMTGTVNLHRVLKAPPERVYRAFTTPEAMAKWLSPYGFTCTIHHMEPRVGGTFKMSFTNFSTQHSHSFSGEYLDLIPNEHLRYTDIFDDPNLPGVIQVSVTLKPVLCGTELAIVQEGIPDVIPVEMCYLGWQESLAQLAMLVEPEIPQ